jgi:hypothetical protein
MSINGRMNDNIYRLILNELNNSISPPFQPTYHQQRSKSFVGGKVGNLFFHSLFLARFK